MSSIEIMNNKNGALTKGAIHNCCLMRLVFLLILTLDTII
jgi:hypothetical protein